MEAIILAIRLMLRRAWRGLKEAMDRSGLNGLPPVPTIAAILAVGLMIPMALAIDKTPTELTPNLARHRLEAFLATPRAPLPAVSPFGPIYSVRPVFIWKAWEGETRFRLDLKTTGEPERRRAEVTEARYPLPAPDSLKEGRQYRLYVDSVGENGRRAAYASFEVLDPDAQADRLEQEDKRGNARKIALLRGLRNLRASALKSLEQGPAAFALAGIYAALGSGHDVRMALSRYLDTAPDGPDADLARAILAK